MCGLKLATLRLDLPILGYDTLRDVERAVVVFREAQDDVNFVFERAGADFLYFGGVVA